MFKRFLFRLFLSFFAAILFIVPVAAQSSLNSLGKCAGQPSCAATLRSLFKVPEIAKSATIGNTQKTVGIEVLNKAGTPVWRGSAAVSSATAAAAAGTIYGRDFGVRSPSKQQVEQVRQQAQERYCAANPGTCEAPPIPFNQGLVNLEYSSDGAWVSGNPIDSNCNVDGGRMTGFNLAAGNAVMRSVVLPGGCTAHWPFPRDQEFPSGDLPQSVRDAIANSITDADLSGILDGTGSISLVPEIDPALDPDRVRVTGVDGQLVCDANGNCTIVPSQDGTIEHPYDKEEAEREEAAAAAGVKPIQGKKFANARKSWLLHGIQVFSGKFPFDMFSGVVAAGSANECPTYTFFNEPFQLCPIRDFIALLKYPVIIGFSIWAVMSI